MAALQAGHTVSLYEASRHWGGRARGGLAVQMPESNETTVLDNGQHILLGAYTDCLQLMRTVGVAPEQVLLRLPLTLVDAQGQGLRLPAWPSPWHALAGVLLAKGWRWRDKASLLRACVAWQRMGMVCDMSASVADLCRGLSDTIRLQLMEPLCVAALNTPLHQASGQVFLRVLQDGLLGGPGASDLLLPRTHLSALLPQPAVAWLQQHGAHVQPGQRVRSLQAIGPAWQVDGHRHDRVILATACRDAIRLLQANAIDAPQWLACAQGLRYEAITTVYAHTRQARLATPMVLLHSSAEEPAQFAFDRAALGGPSGLLALVVSASEGDNERLTVQVLAQARRQLHLPALQALKTVTERQATFACTPGLQRPAPEVADGLLACGDYVQGPYPATLEGAVRSGLAAAQSLN